MKSKTILVVDDEDMIVSIISKSLIREGYNIVTASNHKTALHLIKEANIDLVVSDVMMPYAGGFDLVENMKDDPATRNIPIILVTGMDKDILNASVVQAHAIISKPFDLQELLATVKSELEKVQAQA
jgi:CheY-like chemotaxis protein